jgi:uroporphyrinogen-III synthase
MSVLDGMRVALLEGRMSEELAALVRRYGGEPICVPAMREQRASDAGASIARLLENLADQVAPVVVLLTGVGVAALFDEARALGRGEELRDAMRRATTVCRGPKPVAALKREGVEATLTAKEPCTTADLVEALSSMSLQSQYVAVLHYGERNQPLVAALAQRGVQLHEIMLYEWKMPEDTGPLRALVGEIVAGRVGAVVFTTQIQARHLFQMAAEMGCDDALGTTLRTRAVVAAVGPTCARALEALGVPPRVVPNHPRMGPTIAALAEHLSRGRSRT